MLGPTQSTGKISNIDTVDLVNWRWRPLLSLSYSVRPRVSGVRSSLYCDEDKYQVTGLVQCTGGWIDVDSLYLFVDLLKPLRLTEKVFLLCHYVSLIHTFCVIEFIILQTICYEVTLRLE